MPTLYRMKRNVTFVSLPREAYVVDASQGSPVHYFADNPLTVGILAAVCHAKLKTDKPGITAANIKSAIDNFFHPRPTEAEIANHINQHLGSFVEGFNSPDPGAQGIVFSNPGPLHSPNPSQGPPQIDNTRPNWGKPLGPPNPWPYRLCCG